jgi:hypothetical protein
MVTVEDPRAPAGEGLVLVVSAGTSDGPVAEEACVTARCLGARVETLRDVGVAGVHRLLSHVDQLRRANVIVVVAGMEGALASLVGGITPAPVVAVPTSTGYGASFGGITALLGMLASCASGLTVVGIDNGFGAACAVLRMLGPMSASAVATPPPAPGDATQPDRAVEPANGQARGRSASA